jgi:hypothetical protein
MTPHQSSDWKLLAERASKEMDPEKFMSLIQELNHVLLVQEENLTRATSRGKF